MSEENTMREQEAQSENRVIVAYNNIPYAVIEDDLSKAAKTDYYNEMKEIQKLYTAYKTGQEFLTEGSNANYVPSMLKYKKASSIINKEARFLFAKSPTFTINVNATDDEAKNQNAILQSFLDKVLAKNSFNNKLLKAAKDCFIGKRIAMMLNFNEKNGITLTFLNSTEFLYETLGGDSNELKKIVAFYNMTDTINKTEQRWFKKIYTLEEGRVYVEENVYDGLGVLLETLTEKRETKFTYIPAVVVLNDGLIGEIKGESELGYLLDYESSYSKLANADIDAERKSMNPVRYTIDASADSTESLSSAPGSYWDIQSDDEKAIERQASVGMLESNMSYSEALAKTLDRIENAMYAEVDVPNTTNEQLQGMITSGKTLKALYWGLIVRCDEKMLVWSTALEFIANAIIDGARLYPQSISKYTSHTSLPKIECDIKVENNYPLPEDEAEEKNVDLAEISSNVMSRKTYLKKWRNLTDKEIDEELQQIKFEMDLFDNSMLPPTFDETLGE